MTLVPAFAPAYPGAIVVPANMDNVYSPAGHGGVPNKPRAFIIHTPEEDADDNEGTPFWFQQYHPASRGSTHYYQDSDGDVYQCVPESWGAIANGFNPGIPQRLAYPFWAGAFSLNWQTVSVEVEGRAASIGQTMPVGGVQFNALVKLIRHRCASYGIPLDRDHIMGHYQLAVDRTDPGATFPWAALMAALTPQEDDEMWVRHNEVAVTPYWNGGHTFAPGEAATLQLGIDLPGVMAKNPKAIDLEIYSSSGMLGVYDGNGNYAGQVNDRRREAVIRVVPVNGTIRVAASAQGAGVALFGVVGYLG